MDSRSRDSKRRRVEPLFTGKKSGESSLPNFYPYKSEEPIEKWLRAVEDARKVYNWSESTTIHYAFDKLRGSAETWYKSLPPLKLSWQEWREKLIQAFPATKDYYELLEDMVNRKKLSDETYSKYFFDKLALVNMCKITGRDSVACIIGGLSETIKPSVRIGNFKEPEELYEYLLTFDKDKALGLGSSSHKVDLKETRSKNINNYRDAEPRSSYKGKESYKDKDSKFGYREKDFRGSYKEREPRTDSYREREPQIDYNDKNAASSYRVKDYKDFYHEKDTKVNYREKEFRSAYAEGDTRSYTGGFKEPDLRLTLQERCYSCGGTGHFAKFCPRLKENVCKYCFRSGHSEDQCYDRKMLI